MEVEQQTQPQTEATPEQSGQPAGPSSFEEIFQNMGEGTPAEAGEQAQAPPEGQPSQPVDTPQQPVNNDERRFQYWQSEADKRQNLIDSQQQQINMMQQQMQQKPAQAEPVQQEEKFPEPPRKPTAPAGFSREEAMSDVSSPSAQYQNQVEQWRDSMDEYNYLHSQYNSAKTNETVQKMQDEQQAVLKRQAQEQQWHQQQGQATDYVKGQFGATDEQARDFISRYSDPKSVTMDNLWKLYQLDAGQGQQQTPNTGPSPTFQQVQNAQQVPSPMGVVSGSGQQQQGSVEDQMMSAMVNDHKSTNYF